MTRKLKRSLAALLPLIALSACNEPMITDSDVIRYASEPAYTYDQGGRIFPTSCLTGRSSTYSGTPSSCQRDVVFARQVANADDLVAPRRPAPPTAGPVGRAGDTYLQGGRPLILTGSSGGVRAQPSVVTAPGVPMDPYGG